MPIVIREATDRDVAEMSLIENLQREELNPLEEADAYVTLTEKFSLARGNFHARRQRPLHDSQHDTPVEVAGQGQICLNIKKDFCRSCALSVGLFYHG